VRANAHETLRCGCAAAELHEQQEWLGRLHCHSQSLCMQPVLAVLDTCLRVQPLSSIRSGNFQN
jgi:hypothetical protein